jgi:hypothetical protein
MKYTRGSVSTDRAFNRPSIPAIVAWYDDIKLEAERSNYSAYLRFRDASFKIKSVIKRNVIGKR